MDLNDLEKLLQECEWAIRKAGWACSSAIPHEMRRIACEQEAGKFKEARILIHKLVDANPGEDCEDHAPGCHKACLHFECATFVEALGVLNRY